MEFLLILLILGVSCFILGVKLEAIITAVVFLICLVPALMALMFAVCLLLLIGAKRCPASFTRFQTNKKGKFATAFYTIDGREYPCIFPAESTRLKRLYRTDKTYRVLLSRRIGRVYDRFALTTCILGLISSLLMTGVLIFVFTSF
ncbi:MAG: hypothetical protein IJM44_01415 [Ruminococcus sp.]|nr:hypothetical protein [Ruminococcus sp.]